MFIGKKILIAGGTGFIGKYVLAEAIKQSVFEITVLGRNILHFQYLSKDIEFISIDLRDKENVYSFSRGRKFDYIINLSGRTDQCVRHNIYNEQMRDNFFTTLNLLESFQGKVGRFIQVGSNAEYGVALSPQLENGPTQPSSAYGVSKLAASQTVLAKYHSEEFSGLVVRPFLVYGKGQSPNSFLAMAVDAARRGGEFPTTFGEQTRDFTPVEKVAEEILQLCQTRHPPGRIYNLCTGNEIPLKFVLTKLGEIKKDFLPQFGALPYRETEFFRSVGKPFIQWDMEKTKTRLIQFLQNEVGS